MALIEVHKLEKTFEADDVKTHVLRGVSFEVQKGEFVAIMGPSGSGKSTLLHILGFLDHPTHGRYSFDGKTIREYTQAEMAHARNGKMGFVFQSFNLLARMSVFENVRLPLMYSKVPEHEWDTRTEQAIKNVGLEHRAWHEAGRLSGGEKQRAAIARALVNDPQVIFADEPTGNLDSRSGLVVMEIIQRLNEEQGRTVVLITHETYTAEHAQRIITIHDGQITEDRRVEKRKERGTFVK